MAELQVAWISERLDRSEDGHLEDHVVQLALRQWAETGILGRRRGRASGHDLGKRFGTFRVTDAAPKHGVTAKRHERTLRSRQGAVASRRGVGLGHDPRGHRLAGNRQKRATFGIGQHRWGRKALSTLDSGRGLATLGLEGSERGRQVSDDRGLVA